MTNEITANEARQLVFNYKKRQDLINSVLDLIYEEIKKAAGKGEVSIKFDLTRYIDAKDFIFTKLELLDFHISPLSNSDIYTLRWDKRKCTNRKTSGYCPLPNLQCAYPKCEEIFIENSND
jgi:hypothetical protein